MRVYFTVDTESSIGGAWLDPEMRMVDVSRRVFCHIDDQSFGIPLLTRIMGQFGFRATYFVETLATPSLGEAEVRSVFDFLIREGQDVQLHLHPVFRLYADLQKARREGDQNLPQPFDLIGQLSKDSQMALLTEGIGYFESFAGYRPTAFRAGCFAGSRSLMQCLRECGVLVDSSFNPCYHFNNSFPGETLEPNLVQQIEGVWEIPVTVARTKLPEGYNGFKFADCTSLSFPEIRTMLESAAAGGQEHFVVIFHSFSAVKARDEMYSELRPNRIVIRRLEKLFRYLAENGDKFQVETMGNIAKRTEELKLASPKRVIPTLGVISAIKRKAVQIANNSYWV